MMLIFKRASDGIVIHTVYADTVPTGQVNVKNKDYIVAARSFNLIDDIVEVIVLEPT